MIAQDILVAELHYECIIILALVITINLIIKLYQIVKEPAHWTEAGFASILALKLLIEINARAKKNGLYEFIVSQPTIFYLF